MPVLKTSASDYTAWTRANAVLPTAGKVAKATVTTTNVSIAAVVATASKVAATVAPKTSITSKSSEKSRGTRNGD